MARQNASGQGRRTDLGDMGRNSAPGPYTSDSLQESPSGYDNIETGLFLMGKDTTINRTATLPKVPPRTEPPVRTMSMNKAKRLIRKTSEEHAGLFRRLAK